MYVKVLRAEWDIELWARILCKLKDLIPWMNEVLIGDVPEVDGACEEPRLSTSRQNDADSNDSSLKFASVPCPELSQYNCCPDFQLYNSSNSTQCCVRMLQTSWWADVLYDNVTANYWFVSAAHVLLTGTFASVLSKRRCECFVESFAFLSLQL